MVGAKKERRMEVEILIKQESKSYKVNKLETFERTRKNLTEKWRIMKKREKECKKNGKFVEWRRLVE